MFGTVYNELYLAFFSIVSQPAPHVTVLFWRHRKWDRMRIHWWKLKCHCLKWGLTWNLNSTVYKFEWTCFHCFLSFPANVASRDEVNCSLIALLLGKPTGKPPTFCFIQLGKSYSFQPDENTIKINILYNSPPMFHIIFLLTSCPENRVLEKKHIILTKKGYDIQFSADMTKRGDLLRWSKPCGWKSLGSTGDFVTWRLPVERGGGVRTGQKFQEAMGCSQQIQVGEFEQQFFTEPMIESMNHLSLRDLRHILTFKACRRAIKFGDHLNEAWVLIVLFRIQPEKCWEKWLGTSKKDTKHWKLQYK